MSNWKAFGSEVIRMVNFGMEILQNFLVFYTKKMLV